MFYILKKIIYFFLVPFYKKKILFYVDPTFLGELISLIYIKSLQYNTKITVIIDPFKILSKKKYINLKIFLLAYREINGKKFNSIYNFFSYLFYRSVQYNPKFKSILEKGYEHNDPTTFKSLSDYKEKYFDFNENVKDDRLKKLLKEEFILFHCRDAEYKKKAYNIDMSYHDYRNEDLNRYENSLSSLSNEKNLKLIRFGSIGKQKCKNPAIYDYTFSQLRNETNDIHLMKNCKLYVGTGSGPDTLAINFQKPIVFINWVHLPNLFTFQSNVVAIFKKIYNKKEKKFIKFKDLLDLNFKLNKEKTPVGLYFKSQQYQYNDLEVINNSEDEIYYAVKEMLDYLEGRFNFDKETQNKFKQIYHQNNKNKINNRFFISEYFIKKNLDLFY